MNISTLTTTCGMTIHEKKVSTAPVTIHVSKTASERRSFGRRFFFSTNPNARRSKNIIGALSR